jgi:hypothetical protein
MRSILFTELVVSLQCDRSSSFATRPWIMSLSILITTWWSQSSSSRLSWCCLVFQCAPSIKQVENRLQLLGFQIHLISFPDNQPIDQNEAIYSVREFHVFRRLEIPQLQLIMQWFAFCNR